LFSWLAVLLSSLLHLIALLSRKSPLCRAVWFEVSRIQKLNACGIVLSLILVYIEGVQVSEVTKLASGGFWVGFRKSSKVAIGT
jgi:hypothetical protein